MRPLLFSLMLLAGTALPLKAQKHLEGLWEGVITNGGAGKRNGHRFQLFLELDGHKVSGRTYIYLAKDQIIEMDVQGYLYEDNSVHLQDIEFIPLGEGQPAPPFNRKYQMGNIRSIWENRLEGYWQEIFDDPMDKKRRQGRIFLEKKDGSKA